MPLYAGELNLRRGAPLAEFPAPLSEVLSAQREQTRVESPTNALSRMNELDRAMTGDVLDIGDPTQGIPPTYGPVEMLDAATARTRVADEGVELFIPQEGISRKALDILIKRKRDELRRQDVMSRGPDGIAAGAARLGVALYESLFDPLNIASAFVPVMGPARYARLVQGAASGMGRAGIRAGVGAVEGAAGALILEPLIYSALAQEQADYGMTDSMLNIAFGGLFGGGLHVIGGAVADVIARNVGRAVPEGHAIDEAAALMHRVEPETRESALRTAVAQAVEGRAVEVEPVVRAYHGSPYDFERFDMSRIGTGEGAQAFGHGLYFAESAAVARSYADNVKPLRVEVDTAHVAAARDFIANNMDPAEGLRAAYKGITKQEVDAAILEAKGGLAPRLYGVDIPRGTVDRMLDWDKPLREQPQSVRDALPNLRTEFDNQPIGATLRRAYKNEMFAGDIIGRDRATVDELSAELARRGIPGIRYLDGGSRTAGEGTRNFVLFDESLARIVEKNGQPVTPQEARAAAEANMQTVRSAEPDASRAADAVAAERANADLKAATEELDSALEVLNERASAVGVKVDLSQHDAAIIRAEAYAVALRAGAACGVA